MAMMLPKSNTGTFSLIALSVVFSIAIVALFTPLVLIYNIEIATFLGNKDVAGYLWFVPVLLLLIGFYNPLKFYFIRKADYRIITISQISKSSAQTVFQICLGLINFSHLGLILGFLLSQFAGNVTLIRRVVGDYQHTLVKKVTLKTVTRVGYKYKDFLLYSSWGILIPTVAQNITIFFISGMFGNDDLGQFSFMQRYIAAPLIVLNTTFSQVFMQELAERYRKNQSGTDVFYSYIKKLSIFGLLIMVPMYFLIRPIVAVFFGDTWMLSAVLTQLSIPLFFVRFVALPLQMVASIYEKQKLFLFLQVTTFVVTVVPIVIARTCKFGILDFVQLQNFSVMTWYFLTIIIYYRIIKNRQVELI